MFFASLEILHSIENNKKLIKHHEQPKKMCVFNPCFWLTQNIIVVEQIKATLLRFFPSAGWTRRIASCSGRTRRSQWTTRAPRASWTAASWSTPASRQSSPGSGSNISSWTSAPPNSQTSVRWGFSPLTSCCFSLLSSPSLLLSSSSPFLFCPLFFPSPLLPHQTLVLNVFAAGFFYLWLSLSKVAAV